MIAIGSDHAGYETKEKVKKYLESLGVSFKDFGTYSEESCDYPLFAKAVSLSVKSGESEKGILICGSGIGMSITANKFSGICAALCKDEETSKLSRAHNNANVVCIGARTTDFEEIKKIVNAFLETPFEAGRHQRRLEQITEIENS